MPHENDKPASPEWSEQRKQATLALHDLYLLHALYLAVPPEIARDIGSKVYAYVRELESRLASHAALAEELVGAEVDAAEAGEVRLTSPSTLCDRIIAALRGES